MPACAGVVPYGEKYCPGPRAPTYCCAVVPAGILTAGTGFEKSMYFMWLFSCSGVNPARVVKNSNANARLAAGAYSGSGGGAAVGRYGAIRLVYTNRTMHVERIPATTMLGELPM